jgi:hypothetical protein
MLVSLEVQRGIVDLHLAHPLPWRSLKMDKFEEDIGFGNLVSNLEQ